MKPSRGRDNWGGIVLLLLTAACGAAFLIQGILLPLSQQQMLEQAWRREAQAVQELSGAILFRHPELELELAELLRENGEDYRELGAQILSKYGYRPEGNMMGLEQYREIQRGMTQRSWLFVLTACLLCALVVLWKTSASRKSTRRIEVILNSYLDGDYSFAHTVADKGRLGGGEHLQEDLRRLGNQIRLAHTRLTEEKESTKALVTDISHQLKTPIAALKTCFALFLEAQAEEERQEFMERCMLQMDKLEALTATLMNISRLESAMITLKPEPVDLQELLVQAVNGIFDKAADKNIGVELPPMKPVTLHLDRRWTVEALLNILDNGIKYSPPDTQIKIHIRVLPSFVRVEISDQGVGIPKEEYNKIFQRFYRGSHHAVRSSEGTGVGLYLTRAILENQGGSVHVRSIPGEGSTFIVQLFREL